MSEQPTSRTLKDRAQQIMAASRAAIAAQAKLSAAEMEVIRLRPDYEYAVAEVSKAKDLLEEAEAAVVMVAQESIQFGGEMPEVPAKFRDRIIKVIEQSAPKPTPPPKPEKPEAPAKPSKA